MTCTEALTVLVLFTCAVMFTFHVVTVLAFGTDKTIRADAFLVTAAGHFAFGTVMAELVAFAYRYFTPVTGPFRWTFAFERRLFINKTESVIETIARATIDIAKFALKFSRTLAFGFVIDYFACTNVAV